MRHRANYIVLIIAAVFIIYNGSANAQVVINEFMASNTGVLVDPDYNESADWIEIYNGTDQPVSLNNYYLTDNISDIYKWQIITNDVIEPNAYMLV